MSQGVVQDWGTAVTDSLQRVVGTILGFLPNLIGALVIIVVGIILGVIAGKVIERVSQLLHLDSLFERFGIKRTFERVGVRLSIAKILGWLVKWFVYIIAFLAAADTLQLQALSDFIQNLLNYIPSVFAAVLILVAGTLFAHFLAEIVLGTAEGAKFKAAHLLAAATRWVIIIFSVLGALIQLGILKVLSETVIQGIVAGLAIAFGLAFGLGGQGVARDMLERLRRDMES